MAATSTLECNIGRVSKTFDVPAGYSGDPIFIERHLQEASKGVIRLIPKNHAGESCLVSDDKGEVDALDLHRCIEKLTGNTPGTGKITKIALILADRYRPRPSVLGVMFDRGYTTLDDPNNTPVFTGIPREGCAIFIGAIKDLRPNIDDFDREVEFTTIHELGHVFNLGHISSPSSFMASSHLSSPFPDEYFRFFDEQRNWLSECDTNPAVYPGGSKFDPVSSFRVGDVPARRITAARVALHIGVANSVFPCLSPIELDVELQEISGASRVYVPDRLDPGYEEFKIWITHPNGEKLLFGSPRRYCAPIKRIILTKGRPIHRDISIFEGVGGTTFARPGLYHIQAEFDLGLRGCVASNVVSVEAVVNKKLMPSERVQLFADHSIRRFLYHRSIRCGFKTIKKLEKHLSAHPKGPGANEIRYALIRALAENIHALKKADREKILRLLHSAQEIEGLLGVRQRYHLRDLFDKLEPPGAR